MGTMIRHPTGFSKRFPPRAAGLLLLLFAGLTGLVLAGLTDAADGHLSRAIERADAPWLAAPLAWASAAARPLLLSLLVPVGWSLARRRYRFALLVASGGAGIGALNLAVKLALRHNPPGGDPGRPIAWGADPLAIARQISDSYSYPSGHVATTLVALGLWLLWLWPAVGRPARIALLVAAGGFAALIAYSRVYLGVHVAADTLGGALLGGAWLASTVWAWGRAVAAEG